jgi:hypothetical protein
MIIQAIFQLFHKYQSSMKPEFSFSTKNVKHKPASKNRNHSQPTYLDPNRGA